MSAKHKRARKARLDRFAAIRARLAAASAGAWRWTFVPGNDGNVCIKHDHFDIYRERLTYEPISHDAGCSSGAIRSHPENVGCYLGESADAVFIANARADIEWLLTLAEGVHTSRRHADDSKESK